MSTQGSRSSRQHAAGLAVLTWIIADADPRQSLWQRSAVATRPASLPAVVAATRPLCWRQYLFARRTEFPQMPGPERWVLNPATRLLGQWLPLFRSSGSLPAISRDNNRQPSGRRPHRPGGILHPRGIYDPYRCCPARSRRSDNHGDGPATGSDVRGHLLVGTGNAECTGRTAAGELVKSDAISPGKMHGFHRLPSGRSGIAIGRRTAPAGPIGCPKSDAIRTGRPRRYQQVGTHDRHRPADWPGKPRELERILGRPVAGAGASQCTSGDVRSRRRPCARGERTAARAGSGPGASGYVNGGE